MTLPASSKQTEGTGIDSTIGDISVGGTDIHLHYDTWVFDCLHHVDTTAVGVDFLVRDQLKVVYRTAHGPDSTYSLWACPLTVHPVIMRFDVPDTTHYATVLDMLSTIEPRHGYIRPYHTYTLGVEVTQCRQNEADSTYTLDGVVFDSYDNEPLPGVNIILARDRLRGTISYLDGAFSLSNLYATDRVEISMVGYKTIYLDTTDTCR